MRFAGIISYRGTRFCGWQIQKDGTTDRPSVQGTLSQAIFKISGERLHPIGSGRTDAGVHALGQGISFDLVKREWDPEKLRKGLNAHLPDDVRILKLFEASPEFHAQRNAVKKQYSYYIQQGPTPLPFYQDRSWWIVRSLDLGAMREALHCLQGEHDFLPFQASGAATRTSVRTLFETTLEEQKIVFPSQVEAEYFLIQIRLVGSGFLKQMVRGIVGTLIQIGEGKRPASDMDLILQTLDRSRVGPTAAARGLFLEKVFFELPPAPMTGKS